MTVPLPVQVQANPIPTKAAPETAAAARKRRRRAPAGGAADDCFTCSKRNVKCDRRRPYCSQCLEVGNECSGYKTQLTWGVGVASRGKLRGLSLPIAKAPPVNPVVTKKSPPARSRAGSANTTGQWPEQQDERSVQTGPVQDELDTKRLSPEHTSPTPTTPFHDHRPTHNYELTQVSASQVSQVEATPTIAIASHSHWNNMPFSTSLPADGLRYAKLGPGDGLSSSIDSLSDMEYHLSPMSHSFPREEIPFLHSPAVMYDGFTGHNSPVPQSPIAAMIMEHRTAPTSCPSLVYAPSEHSSSLHSHTDSFEAHLSNKLLLDCDSIVGTPEMDAYSTSAHSNGHFWGPPATDEDAGGSPRAAPDRRSPSLSGWPSTMETQVVQVSPELIAKMPFFMDYYENTMCPSMVFIDGPYNPFREHILQLAAGSRSLQHAICALAACNLRMKRRLSLGQHSRELPDKRSTDQSGGAGGPGSSSPDVLSDSAAAAAAGPQPVDDQTLQEEYQHRNLAVHLLNEQLNDANKSKHDSVLATILLLCHYRMAESGIAKFHTQFAGVKKILSMRRASPYPPSRDSAWMEALFTYFDAISASINDREAQLNGAFYGVTPDALLLPPGSENLVGCDRELFRIIMKLGRLNLLSQHRPVQNLVSPSPSSLSRGVPSRSQSPLDSPLGHVYKPSHQRQHRLSIGVFGGNSHRFDGNGFGTTLDDEEIISAALNSPPAYDDHRSAFWREWKEARSSLQLWEFDAQRLVTSLPGPSPPTPGQVRDLNSLSEAFRYAALLYTERLASPNLPSTHASFRNLVSQVVYYATSLDAGSSAEKFLLWPLFVAGSECVNELQQNIVRSKCRDIMNRSGYMNNLAALDVLERLWAGERKEDSPGSRLRGMMRQGPFNWTKCIGGPGVEVEWIMF